MHEICGGGQEKDLSIRNKVRNVNPSCVVERRCEHSEDDEDSIKTIGPHTPQNPTHEDTC